MTTKQPLPYQYPIFRDYIGQTMICVGRNAKTAQMISIDRPAGRENFELVVMEGNGPKIITVSASKFEEFAETGFMLSDAVAQFIEASKKFHPKAAITVPKETTMVATKAVAKTTAAKAAETQPALKAAIAAMDKGDKKANELALADKAAKGGKKPAAAAKSTVPPSPGQIKAQELLAAKNAKTPKAPTKSPAELKKASDALKANIAKGGKADGKAEKPAKAPKVEKPKVDVAFALGCASVANLKETAKITVLAKANPKKEGTPSHKHFNLYKTGMTVAELLKKGGSRVNLGWDIAYGFVKAK